jgi:flagellar biosynthesis/type III secretory pathway protein FliH
LSEAPVRSHSPAQLADPSAPAPQWAPNALLQSTQAVPRFLRTGWDAAAASDFGPWRVLPGTDPLDTADVLDSVNPLPVTAPASAASASERPVDLNTDTAATGSSVSQKAPAQPTADVQQQIQAAVKAARAQSYEEGVQAGAAQARAAMEAERAHERELLRHLSIELRALHDDPQRFFEPLKRLAVHLAEELVRAELQVSGKVIAQLVQQSLAQLDAGADKAVVSLNPDDLQRLQALGAEATRGLRLQGDPDLRMGSVRVRYNETVVQDLIDNRLEALVRPLLNDPEAWLSHSGLLNPVQAMPADKTGTAAEPPWRRGAPSRSAVEEVEDAMLREPVDSAGDGSDTSTDGDTDTPGQPGAHDHGL